MGMSGQTSPASSEPSMCYPACSMGEGVKRPLEFKEEEQASGPEENKKLKAVEDDPFTLFPGMTPSEIVEHFKAIPGSLINKVLIPDQAHDIVQLTPEGIINKMFMAAEANEKLTSNVETHDKVIKKQEGDDTYIKKEEGNDTYIKKAKAKNKNKNK